MQRRAFERIPAELEARIFCGNIISTGIVTNLSENGMFISTKTCLHSDAEIDVVIKQNGKILKLPVNVIRAVKVDDFNNSSEKNGMGVALLHPSPEYVRFINGLRLLKQLQRSLGKLQSLDAKVNVLTSAIVEKDPYTASHQHRVAKMVYALAKEMGLLENQIRGIRMAAVLHDIGRVYLDVGILCKPGELNLDELSMIKTHSQIGYDILKTIEFKWPVAQIVLQHHERWNGSGYPSGLSGENILLEARILAVADVVEAMSSHRTYRPAHGIDKALEEISQNKGVLYDTKAVDVCLNIFTKKGFKFE